MADLEKAVADVLVVFGITGDLAKKMTFRSLYRLERRRMLACPVVGVARDDWSRDQLIDHARQAIEASGEHVDGPVFDRLAQRLSYVSGDYADGATYERVAKTLDGKHHPVFYLEIPPSLFGRVVEGLAAAGLTSQARVVVEKPFGHDLASARALNAELRRVLDEWQILRIDHFLGKEPAMDILFLRFANSIFEPLWDRHHIAVRPAHHGGRLRGRGPGQLLRLRWGRCVTSSRTIFCSSSGWSPPSHRRSGTRTACATSGWTSSRPSRRSTPPTTSVGSTRATWTCPA